MGLVFLHQKDTVVSPFDAKLNVLLLAVWHLKIGSTASRVITAAV